MARSLEESDDDLSPNFIIVMWWKNESPTMLAANSQGTIKALILAPSSFNLFVEIISSSYITKWQVNLFHVS
jgi:hypothetical protein